MMQLYTGIGIVYEQVDSIDDLTEIVRRDVCRHTYRYADTSVHKQIRKTRGQYDRFFQLVIVVGAEIDRVLIDIRQHLVCDLRKPCLGITVCGRRVAVNGTEVSVTVHHRIAKRKILRETNHSVIYGSVTVGVILTEHFSDGVRAFAVRLVRGVARIVHRIDDTSVYRLKTVPYVRQRTRNNDRHRVVKERGAHFLFYIFLIKLFVGVYRFNVVLFHFPCSVLLI